MSDCKNNDDLSKELAEYAISQANGDLESALDALEDGEFLAKAFEHFGWEDDGTSDLVDRAYDLILWRLDEKKEAEYESRFDAHGPWAD